MSAARGVSLVELMVALPLAALVAVFSYHALRMAVRLTAKTSQRSKAQIEATLVWNELLRDLHATAADQLLVVELDAHGRGMWVPQIQEINASGSREWASKTVLLHWDKNRRSLVRRLSNTNTLDRSNPVAPFLTLLQAPRTPQDRNLSDCVHDFQATLPSPNLVDLVITFKNDQERQLRLAGCIGVRN